MPNLAAKLEAQEAIQFSTFDNVIQPGGIARVRFESPPRSAKNVVATIIERVKLWDKHYPYRKLGWFEGEFANGEFLVKRMVGAPRRRGERRVDIHVIAGKGEGRGHLTAFAPDPREVVSHSLTVEVTADGFDPFKGRHRLHVGRRGAVIVFNEGFRSDKTSYVLPARQLAKVLGARSLSPLGKVRKGPWEFSRHAPVVYQIKMFHEVTGVRVAEVHTVGHVNNGLELRSPELAQILADHATADLRVVWHGCYACDVFKKERQRVLFSKIPNATVYGHRIFVQAGMPWDFHRVRNSGEVDIQAVIGEVLPRAYVDWWVGSESKQMLVKTLKAKQAEPDVKELVREELARRP